MFQIETFFIKEHIEYRSSGKNVGPGNINICCLYCQEQGYHLSVSLKKGLFVCWVCGNKGNHTSLVAKIKGITYLEATFIVNEKSDLKKVLDERNKKVTEMIKKPNINKFTLPEYSYAFSRNKVDIWQNIAYQYIMKKYDISFDSVVEANLHYCIHGDYKNSIVVPIYRDHKLMNFLTRKWDSNAKQRYKNCPNDLALMNIKDTLYNYDNIKTGQDLVIVVESAFSAIKIGLNRAVATFGVETTDKQLKLLIDLKPKQTVVLFDNDFNNKATWVRANEVADYLSAFMKVKAVRIPYADKDPCDLNLEEINGLL